MKKTLALLTLMSAFATAPAFAEDVEFTANVSSSCGISVITNGTLGVNGDASVLSSTNVGGSSGVAEITANSNLFDLAVTDPTAFSAGSAPVGTTFASSTDFNGGTILGGADASVPVGTTTATVDLTVDAGTGNSFANGSYTALVTLICS